MTKIVGNSGREYLIKTRENESPRQIKNHLESATGTHEKANNKNDYRAKSTHAAIIKYCAT